MSDLPRILVVEDEEIIRTSLCEFLGEEGYEVVVAESVAAVRALSDKPPYVDTGFDVSKRPTKRTW